MTDLRTTSATALALADWSPLVAGTPFPPTSTPAAGFGGSTARPRFRPSWLSPRRSTLRSRRTTAQPWVPRRVRRDSLWCSDRPSTSPGTRRRPRPRSPRRGPVPDRVLGAAHVRGVQGNRIMVQLKHYIAYDSETRRTGFGPSVERGDAMDVRSRGRRSRTPTSCPSGRRSTPGPGRSWAPTTVSTASTCASSGRSSTSLGRSGDGRASTRPTSSSRSGTRCRPRGGAGRARPGRTGRTDGGDTCGPQARRTRSSADPARPVGSGLVDHPLPEPSPPSTPRTATWRDVRPSRARCCWSTGTARCLRRRALGGGARAVRPPTPCSPSAVPPP